MVGGRVGMWKFFFQISPESGLCGSKLFLGTYIAVGDVGVIGRGCGRDMAWRGLDPGP